MVLLPGVVWISGNSGSATFRTGRASRNHRGGSGRRRLRFPAGGAVAGGGSEHSDVAFPLHHRDPPVIAEEHGGRDVLERVVARGADEHADLSLGHLERELGDRDRVVGKALGDAVEPDHGAGPPVGGPEAGYPRLNRSEEHTSELQSRGHLVCRLLLEKKKKKK